VSRIATWVTRRPWVVLIATVLVSVLAALELVDPRTGAPRLGVDPSYDRFVPEDTPERAFNDEMIRRFGNDDTLTLAVVAPDVFSPDVLPRIEAMSTRFRRLDGVREVVSLSTALNIKGEDGDLRIEPFYTGSVDPEELHRLRDEALANPIYSGNLVAKDGQATAMLVILQDMSEYEFAQSGIDERLQAIADEERGDARVWITGPSHIKAEVTRTILSDIALVMPAAYLAIALIAFLSFRTLRGVLVPSLTVGIALLWTLALMAATGRSINLVTTIVPPVILTVGFAYTVHLISGYRAALRAGLGEPVRHALEEVLLPLLLTALTTCVGLLALTISPLGAIREFGVFAAIGVAATVLVSITFAPAVLQLLPAPRRAVAERSTETSDRWLEALARFDLRHRRWILVVGAIVTVAAVAGIGRIRVSNDLISMFPDEHPVRRAFVAINDRLDGANPFYVVLTAEEGEAFKQPYNLKVVEELADWIEDQEGVGSVTSLVDYVKIIHWGFRENRPEFMAIPETAALTDQLLFFGGNEELESFVDSRYQITRILVRSQVIDSADLRQLLTRVRERLETLPDHIEGRIGGSTVLVSEASDAIARGQVQSLVLAMLAIYLILAALFTSFWIGFVALVPNVVPVLVYFGALGWFEIPLNTTTGLAACVVLGIAVDDSIHYITRFNLRAKERADVHEGAVDALRDVGRPVTYTTAALVAGFLMIPVAELRNQTYFGLLSAFTLFVAWVVDMTLTPALCSGLRIVTLWERLTLDLGPDPQHSIPLLADLRRSQARIVALMTDLRSFEPGQVLFRDGEAGEDMYVVVEGELVVWIEDEHEGRRELGRMHRGDVVGEVAPFSGRRTANVATVGRARLLRITMEDLEALRRRYPKIGATVYRNLARVVAGRVADTMAQLR
jgi:predicted RND superfamily exporter protein